MNILVMISIFQHFCRTRYLHQWVRVLVLHEASPFVPLCETLPFPFLVPSKWVPPKVDLLPSSSSTPSAFISPCKSHLLPHFFCRLQFQLTHPSSLWQPELRKGSLGSAVSCLCLVFSLNDFVGLFHPILFTSPNNSWKASPRFLPLVTKPLQ